MNSESPNNRRFNSYAAYFRRLMGGRVQKLSINAALGCPNRDGRISTGGCTFCINEAFTPSYCDPAKSITQQIDEGIEFHTRRYRTAEGYLAYFQSYSNTYAPLEHLRELYSERFRTWSIEEYIDLFVKILRRLRPDLVVERFAGEAPPRYHHTEGWGLVRNEQLLAMLDARLEVLDARQGDLYKPQPTQILDANL